MTMQITSSDVIASVPLTQVREFFRYLVAWHRDSFELSALLEHLQLTENLASVLARELAARGYTQLLLNGSFQLTDKGLELVRASASGTIKRRTAETALTGMLQRVEQYNSDEDKILTIDAVVVFGSFLSTKEELGDLDVAVKYHDRTGADRAKSAYAYAERSGRSFSNFVEFLAWPDTEMCQILKARKRTIKIQNWNSFIRIAVKDPDRFAYKVVFGSAEQVKAEIRARSVTLV